MNSGRLRVGLIAGEPSGDALGAALIAALRRQVPDIECFGVAGPAMRAAGCRALYPAEDLAVALEQADQRMLAAKAGRDRKFRR